jgi:hypothetical protein
MAKGGEAKVSQDDELDDDSYTYDDLVQMLNDANDYMCKEKKKLKELKKSHEVLLNSYEELKKSREDLNDAHESLKVSHEDLKETHEKLVEAHNSCLAHENKSKVSIGTSCDILNNLSCAPSSSKPSSSSSNVSCVIDDFTCDTTLLVENDVLREENELLKCKIESLNNDLGKCFVGETKLKCILGYQKMSINKEGLGYAPKKGKEAFVPQKTKFVKNKGKNVVNETPKKAYGKGSFVSHKASFVKNKGKLVIGECSKKNDVSFNIVNSCYILKKNIDGNIIAKFVGNPKTCVRKNAIWVPKVLVTNIRGPKQVWVPKRN